MNDDRIRNRVLVAAGGLGALLAVHGLLGRASEADLDGQVALITGGSAGWAWPLLASWPITAAGS